MSPKSVLSKGPYVSIEQDQIYFPVEHYTYNEARSEAAGWAREFLDMWGRSKYMGKWMVPLHDHEDWEYCEDCPAVRAWHFDIYEVTEGWQKR